MMLFNERPFFEVEEPDGDIPLAATGDQGDADHNADGGDGNPGE